jgi:hypothetical protein
VTVVVAAATVARPQHPTTTNMNDNFSNIPLDTRVHLRWLIPRPRVRMNPDDLRRIIVLGLANTSSIGFALRP